MMVGLSSGQLFPTSAGWSTVVFPELLKLEIANPSLGTAEAYRVMPMSVKIAPHPGDGNRFHE